MLIYISAIRMRRGRRNQTSKVKRENGERMKKEKEKEREKEMRMRK
jgi:hypothetical protein